MKRMLVLVFCGITAVYFFFKCASNYMLAMTVQEAQVTENR
jgi:hypothetical protein